VATTLFRLTQRGKDLEPVIAALGRWGAPLLAESAGPDAVFRDHWAALPMRLYIRDQAPGERGVQLGLRVGKELMTLETVGDGSVRVQPGKAAKPDAIIEGPPRAVLSLLTGRKTLAQAKTSGVKVEGNLKSLRRFGAD
jgi:hypothetical protein